MPKQAEGNHWVFQTPEYRSLYKMYIEERKKRACLESAILIPKPRIVGKDEAQPVDAWAMAEEAIERARRKP